MADSPSSAASAPSNRVRRHLEEAEQAAGIAGVPAGASATPDSMIPKTRDPKTGISFFNGKPATAAQKAAKQQGLVNKLRARDKTPVADREEEEDL